MFNNNNNNNNTDPIQVLLEKAVKNQKEGKFILPEEDMGEEKDILGGVEVIDPLRELEEGLEDSRREEQMKICSICGGDATAGHLGDCPELRK